MKRFPVLVLVAVLALTLGACCSVDVEKGALTRLEQQHDKLGVKYLKYVDADPQIGGPNATEEQRTKLLQLTERYCVVYQTLKSAPPVSASLG